MLGIEILVQNGEDLGTGIDGSSICACAIHHLISCMILKRPIEDKDAS